MAGAFVRNHNVASSTALGSFIGITASPSFAPQSGNVLIIGVVFDNISNTTPTVTSITKPGSETNNWVQLGTWNAPTSTQQGSTKGELWGINLSTTWAFGQSITINLSGSVPVRIVSLDEFSGVSVANITSTPGGMTSPIGNVSGSTTGTLPNSGDLALGFAAWEYGSISPSGDNAWSLASRINAGNTLSGQCQILQYQVLDGTKQASFSPLKPASTDGGAIVLTLGTNATPVSKTISPVWNTIYTPPPPAPGNFVIVATSKNPADAGAYGTYTSITLPNGIQANDIIVIQGTEYSSPTLTMTTSGFTPLYTGQLGSGGTYNVYGFAWYKIANGTESGTTINFTVSNGNKLTCAVLRGSYSTLATSTITVVGGTTQITSTISANVPAPTAGRFNLQFAHSMDTGGNAFSFTINPTPTDIVSGYESQYLLDAMWVNSRNSSSTIQLPAGTSLNGSYVVANWSIDVSIPITKAVGVVWTDNTTISLLRSLLWNDQVVIVNWTAELWEAGVFKANLGTIPVVGKGVQQVLNWHWDASQLSDPTGNGVELRLYTDHQADLGAIAWDADLIPLVTILKNATGLWNLRQIISNLTIEDFSGASLPGDIITNDVARVYLTSGALHGTGGGDWWYFNGPRFQTNGDFDISMDVMLDPANTATRDIFNLAFWINAPGATANGFMYRVDNTAGGGSGFHVVTGGAHTPLVGTASPPVASAAWYTVRLRASGNIVTATLTRLSDGVVVDTNVFDATTYLDATHTRGGTFGQKNDGVVGPSGHLIDNVIIRGGASNYSWNSRAAILEASNYLWNQRLLTSIARQELWNTRQAVSQSRANLWTVNQALVKAVQELWNDNIAIAKADQILWNEFKAIAQSRQDIWNTFAPVIISSQEIWNDSQTLSLSRQELWNERQAISQSRQEIWNTAQAVAQSRQSLWNFFARVQQSRNELWTVNLPVTKTSQELWNDNISISDQVQTLWNIGSNVAVLARAFIWNDLAGVAVSRQELWTLRQEARKSYQELWNTFAAIMQSREIDWSDASSIRVIRDLLWTLIAHRMVNVWLDSAWRQGVLNVWTGTEWNEPDIKIWNGSSWT